MRRVAAGLPGSPHVESVNPTCLAEVHAMFRRVGDLLGAREAAERLIARIRGDRRRGRPAPRGPASPPRAPARMVRPALLLRALEPRADRPGRRVEVIGRPGARSRRLSWDEVAAADPEIIVLTPCGFTLDRSEAELPALLARPEWSRLSAVQAGGVVLVDGSAYFSRPGPRLEASLRIAAAAIEPDRCGDLAPSQGWRRLPVVSHTWERRERPGSAWHAANSPGDAAACRQVEDDRRSTLAPEKAGLCSCERATRFPIIARCATARGAFLVSWDQYSEAPGPKGWSGARHVPSEILDGPPGGSGKGDLWRKR